MKTTKKGFTLIELMVVIVIIGILAAIAIPKLFGMSAKAKASEVGPAAGTWSKLQQAYLLETSKLGNGKTIGYTPPGATQSGTYGSTGTFEYTADGGWETDGVSEGSATWVATNLVPLNDCKGGSGSWEATAAITPAQQSFKPEAVVSGADAENCKVLTPNFNKLE